MQKLEWPGYAEIVGVIRVMVMEKTHSSPVSNTYPCALERHHPGRCQPDYESA